MIRYRIVFAIDLVLLWSRLGGAFAIFAAIAAFISSKSGAPPWLGWLLGAVAVGLAIRAVIQVIPAVTVWQRGMAVTGRVIEIQQRRNRGSEHVSLKTRVHFAFQFEGHEYAGVSTWGAPSRTALLAVGGPIELCHDPRKPGGVFWEEDLPIRMPPVAFS